MASIMENEQIDRASGVHKLSTVDTDFLLI